MLPQDEYFRLTRSAQNNGLAQRLLEIFSDIPLDAGGDLFGKIYEYFLAFRQGCCLPIKLTFELIFYK